MPPLPPNAPILVVDDNTAHGRWLGLLLRGEGWDVRVAASAEEALAILATFPARVMVLDLALPRMSGLLLAEQLKRDPATRDITLIALTAFDGKEIEAIARGAGCVTCAHKPIARQAFLDLFRTHVERAA